MNKMHFRIYSRLEVKRFPQNKRLTCARTYAEVEKVKAEFKFATVIFLKAKFLGLES
jgi:hypothetical protein